MTAAELATDLIQKTIAGKIKWGYNLMKQFFTVPRHTKTETTYGIFVTKTTIITNAKKQRPTKELMNDLNNVIRLQIIKELGGTHVKKV